MGFRLRRSSTQSHATSGLTLSWAEQPKLATLDDWAAPGDAHTVLLFEAIGGTGKSMLTWEWTTRHAPGVRGDWAGRFWYSFYEKGAVMADFCRRALAYMTGQPIEQLSKMNQAELSELLFRLLQARPWLLVLDGLERVLIAYHRYDAAQVRDEQAGRTDEIARRDPCAAIRPEDDDLLRSLAGAGPSKILITSRLVPRVLLNRANQPILGVLHERLPGLRPAEAEALLRDCGVQGDSHTIRTYLQRHCDCHPLVTGIVAGLVNDYLPARGHFDPWAAAPEYGGGLDLAELDLVQKRNHILRAALMALSDTDRQLLSTLALLSEAVDYNTLSAFNPHLPNEPQAVPEPVRPDADRDWAYMSEQEQRAAREVYELAVERYAGYRRRLELRQPSSDFLAAPRNLALTVRNLEQRGLLQYDRQAGRYDLHPVVRGIAAGGLRPEDRERLGQRVVDHFSTRRRDPYEEAESLDDLQDGLTVVRTLLRMGRMQAAYDAYRGDLSMALSVNLEANAEIVSLLSPFFTRGWLSPSANLPDGAVSYLATDVALALEGLGELNQAIVLHKSALQSDIARRNWTYVTIDLMNLATALERQNNLAQAERYLAQALELAELTGSYRIMFVTRLHAFRQLANSGREAEAQRMWTLLDPMGREWPRYLYKPGDAEVSYARFQLDRETLAEEHLARAEQLARSGHNRHGLRQLYALRGEWLLERNEWAGAAESLAEAVRLAREANTSDPEAEARHATARLRLEQRPAPDEEAERLAGLPKPAHLPLAELWQAIGDRDRATRHALAAYRLAWADGEPHVRRYDLKRATRLLTMLDVEIPALPVYVPAIGAKLPGYDMVAAAIETLRNAKPVP